MKKQKHLLSAIIFLVIALVSSCKKSSKIEGIEKVPKDCNCKAEVALPDVKSEIITFGKGAKSIQIEKKGNVYVLGGDMILTQQDVNYIRSKYEKNSGIGTRSAVIWDKLWYDSIVYYTIDASLPNTSRVTDAMAHWSANTSIRFVQRTNQSNFVTFIPGSGCSSNVGRIGGQQFINLANGCSLGNVIHEIGHAVGLFHEQSRNDRDSYINVNMNNVVPDLQSNFQKYNISAEGADVGTFDFNSVMLYSSSDFSKNGQPTMTKKDGSLFTAQRYGLSQGDINGVWFLYNPIYFVYDIVEQVYQSDQFTENRDQDVTVKFYKDAARTIPGLNRGVNFIISKGRSTQGESSYYPMTYQTIFKIYSGLPADGSEMYLGKMETRVFYTFRGDYEPGSYYEDLGIQRLR